MSGRDSEELSLFNRRHPNYTEPAEDDDSSAEEETTSYMDDKESDGKSLQESVIMDEKSPAEINDTASCKGKDDNQKPDSPESPCAIPPYDEILGHTHESAMQVLGFGRLQYALFTMLGLAMIGDGTELLLMAYILPGAETELCMTAPMKGWLGAIAFAGMLVGALIWGNMADKIGRKPTLITSLGVNAGFAIAGAFMPTYTAFFICRLLSGIGIGGSIPVAMAYASELSDKQRRGWRLGILLTCWTIGGVYCATLGWLIIPSQELNITISEHLTFSSWRVFILLAVIPVVLAFFGIMLMPESPRFLLQAGRDLEALSTYRKIYLWNHTHLGAEYEMPEIVLPQRSIEKKIPFECEENEGSCDLDMCLQGLYKLTDSFMQLFYTPLTLTSFIMMVLWFSSCFGYYGMSIWFPEYMKRLQQERYYEQTNYTINAMYSNTTFTRHIENMHFTNTTFHNITFKNLELLHIMFDTCTFEKCTFKNVTTHQTYFLDSQLYNTKFIETNLYPSRFHKSLLENTTFLHNMPGCQVDIDYNYKQRWIFLESLISQLVVVPCSVVASLLLNHFGRVPILVICLMLSGVSLFFVWAINTEIAVVGLNAVFSCLINGAFNCIDVTSTEQYPTNLRATAFGFLSGLGRIAAILGNVTFGNLIDVSKAIPILITSVVLFSGGLVALRLPESKGKNV